MIVLLAICALVNYAQTQETEEKRPKEIAQDNLPQLETLIATALKHSPLLKKQNSEILRDAYEVKRIKKYWLDALSVGTSYQVSTAGQIIMDQMNQGYAVSALDQENKGYLLTFSLRFSLYDVWGRNNQVKVAYHELQSAVHQKDIYAQQIRQQVIFLYNRLKRALKLLAIRSEARQAAEVHRQMAEKEFVEGEIPVSELARVTEIEAKAIEGFETVQIEYMEAFQQLENFIGQKISTLK